MRDQCVERLGHVAVAQVLRRHLRQEHRAVIRFGVLDQAGVLLGVEKLVLGHATVELRVLRGLALQFDQLTDDFLLARFGQTSAGSVPVNLRILAKW